jgi:hypothetical protein
LGIAITIRLAMTSIDAPQVRSGVPPNPLMQPTNAT